ncbi:PepSY domain-containing protein [Krasilnikovia sp. MM14-A1004]|uniref:PepSY domain-containing protein n=1 Tax=Krasilnikovia sp. MM14-A1004 TaxID=3373541 RepID=UPI00399CC1A9
MISIRTAGTLAAGVAAALALGGTALAASGADDSAAHVAADDKGGDRAVPMLPNGDPVRSSDDSTSAPTSAPAAPTAAGAVSIDAARTIALRAAGGGRVTDIEAETEHGRAVWDVDVVVGGVRHDIDVDRATGAVLRHRVKGSSGSTTAGDDRGRGRGSDDAAGDDRGGRGTEAGDDHGSRSTEAGDDRGGNGTEAGDDHGSRSTEAGDDRGGNGTEAGDDHGSGRHGSDD